MSVRSRAPSRRGGRSRCIGLVVLVANIANELLEQILERDEARGFTSGIAYDGEMQAFAQHPKEQLAAGRVDRRARNRTKWGNRLGTSFQHVERVHHSTYVIERSVIDRNA